MTNFVNYLLESGISLSLFALVYFLFLRRETFFSINRWFLLVSIGFSAFLPLLHIPFYTPQATVLQEVTVTPYINLLSSVTIYGTALSHGAEQFVLNFSLLGYAYLLGVAVFAGIFFLRVYQIIRLIAQNIQLNSRNPGHKKSHYPIRLMGFWSILCSAKPVGAGLFG